MPAFLLTPPVVEPVTLAEAKEFLRVSHDDDDGIIAALTAAARNHIEALTRRCLMTQTWRFVADAWPRDGRIRLRLGPIRSVAAVRQYAIDDSALAVDAERFVIDAPSDTLAAPPWSLTAPGRAAAGIEIDVVMGFGDSAGDVPPLLRQAIRQLMAHWYENRGLIAIGQSVAMMPGSVNAMIASYRAMSL
jgi:uncharacterized phiE125 gp8 family phage protein